jgi:hypothetical protein
MQVAGVLMPEQAISKWQLALSQNRLSLGWTGRIANCYLPIAEKACV